MLGNCVLRNPTTSDGVFDKGSLCETLLFFNKTHLLIDMATLANMAKAEFLDDLIVLLKEGHISGNYSPQMAVMFNDGKGGLREHFFTVAKIGGDQKKPNMRNPELLEQQLGRILDDKGKSRRYFRELADIISFKDIGDNGVPELGRGDFCDANISHTVARMALEKAGIPKKEISFSKIEILPLEGARFAISSDIDFDRLRKFVPVGDQSTFSQDILFPAISDARLDIGIAAAHNAAFVGNEDNKKIITMILARSMGSRFDSETALQEIYDYISISIPTVREVINSDQRTSSEFISLLNKAKSFKYWMNVQNPNADLVREMLVEKTRTDWLDSLPAKAVRFGLFTGGGMLADLVAPGSGVGMGAIDSFLVDRFRNNWRPHYFVETHLRGFLEMQRAT